MEVGRAFGVAVAVALVAVAIGRRDCGNSGFDPDDVEYSRFGNEHLAIDVPGGWKVVDSTSLASHGRHKLEYRTKEFVELVWEPVAEELFEETIESGRAALAAVGLELVSDSRTTAAAYSGATLIGRLDKDGKRAWMSLVVVRCAATGMSVSFTVAAAARGAAERLGKRMLDSLECRGSSNLDEVRALPGTNLGEAWGFAETADGFVVVDRSNQKRVELQASASNLAVHWAEQPQIMAKTVTAAAGVKFELVSGPKHVEGLGGAEFKVYNTLIDGEPLSLGLAYCEKADVSMLAFVGTDDGKGADLLGAFGCPGAGRPIDQLTPACKLGIVEFCE